MKIYAELYGDIQKFRIKSRSDNTVDALNTMTETKAVVSKLTENCKPAFDRLAFTLSDFEVPKLVTTDYAERIGYRPIQK